MKTIYNTKATALGGRNGQVKSENGILDLAVQYPKALGGANDDFANPEMLFAAGYAACFDSALNLVIKKEKIETGETSVSATVGIGPNTTGGFALEAALHANIPGVTLDIAQDLIEKAHQVCPYSNATRGNMEVTLTVSNDEVQN
jgi:Ohr subfamily peroxiredoxin